MNKFMKGCFIAAFVFILIGIIMVVSAFAVGGIDQVTDIVRSGEFDLIRYVDNEWYYDDYEDFDEDFDEDYEELMRDSSSFQEISIGNLPEMEDVKNLTIDVGESFLYIRTTTDSHYSVESNYTNRLKCYVDGDKLIIAGRRRYRNISLEDKKIYINVPADAQLSSIDISMGAGRVIADKLLADEVNVDVGAGKIDIKEMVAEDASFDVGVGELILKNAVLGTAEMSVATGKMDFQGAIRGDLDASCSMGMIEMILEGKEEDHNYEIEASMGSIEIGNHTTNGFSGERTIQNGANSEFELSCSMGTIQIDFKE